MFKIKVNHVIDGQAKTTYKWLENATFKTKIDAAQRISDVVSNVVYTHDENFKEFYKVDENEELLHPEIGWTEFEDEIYIAEEGYVSLGIGKNDLTFSIVEVEHSTLVEMFKNSLCRIVVAPKWELV